ncbi:MAG TPA: biotin--[acetyl-CoA-carboxylase] ligase [Acidimicrobiia bacterium]|nr:biotin--[acetyl-CoA-carboxylase] ligase [Acidimicrobiia bacterium]
MATPYSLQVYDEVTSTQDVAAAALVDDPILVVTGRQTEGRGRSRRTWESAPRAMAASLAFRPTWGLGSWPLIPLVAGLAVADVLDAAVGLKWPNDLLLGESKIGGILVEGSAGVLVVGCGLNLWWPDPLAGSAALYVDDPGPEAMITTATAWAGRLLQRLAGGPGDWGRNRYLDLSATVGRRVTWEPDGEGKAIDIDETGALVVETTTGRKSLIAGEIRHLRAV